VRSDVDVVGYNPRRRGVERVWVVSCKAWQGGFPTERLLAELRGERRPEREVWRRFRELWVPKWAEAFKAKIRELTGQSTFRYWIAVTRLHGDGDAWAEDPRIRENLSGCSFDFLTLEEMWATMIKELTTTPAGSEMGRLAQLLKAAGLTAETPVRAPRGPAPGSDAAIQDERDNES
jgi:hypothetical protein